jgi:hypothetical protein
MRTREAASYVRKQSPAAANTLVVRDLAALQEWRRQLHSITSARNLPAPLFQFPKLSDEQNSRASARANGHQKACGCQIGSALMSFTAVALIVWHFASGIHLSNSTLSHVASLAGITVASALLGKLLGLLWARYQLLRLASNIHDVVVRAARRDLL